MASIKVEPGSGFHDTYLSSLLFSLDANKSISGKPNFLVILSKVFVGIAHSAESVNSLDAVSASTLCAPGIWAAEI